MYPKESVISVVDSLNKYGITNPYIQGGILATISKESGFKPKNEIGYSGTSASRIKKIFGTSRFAGLSDSDIEKLANNNVAFFEKVYGKDTAKGKELGNTQYGDGYKYRGRGFNGITGRGIYKKYSDITGIDIINNPDKLNDIKVASEMAALYFKRRFDQAKKDGTLKKRIGVSDINQIKDYDTGIKASVQANAGFGKSLDTEFGRENIKRAKANLDALIPFIGVKDTLNLVKKNSKLILPMTLLAIGIGASIYLIVKLKK